MNTQQTFGGALTVAICHSQRSAAFVRTKCLRGYHYFDDNTADWFGAGKDGSSVLVSGTQ